MTETDRTSINAFDLAQPPIGFIENPYPFYTRLREEAPIKRMSDGSALLSRHADLEAVYKRPDAFISDKKIEFAPKFGVGTPLYEHHTTSLVFNDRPLHTRVRKLIAAALTPRAIIALEPELIGLIDILLDAMESKGTADLIEDFETIKLIDTGETLGDKNVRFVAGFKFGTGHGVGAEIVYYT